MIFIFSQRGDASQFSFPELLATFWYGSKLDISTTAYYLLVPVLLAIPGVYFNGDWYRYLTRWYTYLMIIVSSLIIVSDANLYSYWGFRMDYTPMFYLKTPEEAMASVSTGKIILFFISITGISFLSIIIYNRFIDSLFDGLKRLRYWLVWVLFFMILWGSLIIPIRGGFGLAPINAGSVYFSKKMFLNHVAVNSVWNVGTTAFTHKPVKNPYQFDELSNSSIIVDSLTVKKGIDQNVLNTSNPNIILIVLESFSGYLIGPLGGDSLVTPNFNRYIKEGILFSDFYASGNRTDKAMPAILSGYPAQPAQSIIKEPKKSQSLPSIVKTLNDKGYRSSFWYGGEINFANFNSYVISSGFNEIITKNNFDPAFYNSKWGVHDHILFNTLKDSMQSIREPFLNVILTLSSHEPFDVPMDPVFSGEGNMIEYKNSVFYADSSLGSFIDWAKEREWWKNTLIILVADHCCKVTSDMIIYSRELFKIPMLWLGGALAKQGIIIEKKGSQVDIPLTLMNQLGMPGDYRFAKDLLSDRSNSFAFYTYNEGFGFITDSSAVIYDQKLGNTVLKEGKGSDYAEKTGKAYLQVLFDDYLKK